MPPIGGFFIQCSLSIISMIVYTPAPLGPARRDDWRADPYLCGLTEVRTRYERPAPIMRRFDVVAPVFDEDIPF